MMSIKHHKQIQCSFLGKIVALTTLLIVSYSNFAIGQSFWEGDRYFQFGIGVLPTYYSRDFKVQVPPVSITYEKAVTDFLGIGAFAAVSTARTPYYPVREDDEYWWNYSYYMVGGRGAFHFKLTDDERFDTYAGLIGGIRLSTNRFLSASGFISEDAFTTKNGSGILFSAFAGTRFKPNDKTCFFAEIGWGYSLLNLGIVIRK